MDEIGQAEAIRTLASGEATGEGAPLKPLQTHMSYVFLGRTHAYKLKRARRHPFADLSSLAERKRCCDEEIAINQRLAPGLYERAAPLAMTPNGPRLDGGGEIVDWVVVMRRFADGALLSELADCDRLTPALVRETVEAVAAFHVRQPPVFDGGREADYRAVLQGLRRTAAEGAKEAGFAFEADDLFVALDERLRDLGPLIERRRRKGWTRRGHGDLHLRNICVFQGRATPFDALEFDPVLATADVVHDIAFLLMDLRARGLHSFANLAMNRYWDVSRQPEEALAVLPLFMGMRASVRMAVALEAGDLREAEHYRAVARDVLERPTPRLFAIGGLSGTGKTTLARTLAPDLGGPCGARLLRSDVIRKAEAGVAETDRLPDVAYRPAEVARVYRILQKRVCQALEAGAVVIADATFQKSSERQAIAEAAVGRPFTGLWLSASVQLRTSRLAERPPDASDANAAVATLQSEPAELGSGWRRLDAGQSFNGLRVQAAEACSAANAPTPVRTEAV